MRSILTVPRPPVAPGAEQSTQSGQHLTTEDGNHHITDRGVSLAGRMVRGSLDPIPPKTRE